MWRRHLSYWACYEKSMGSEWITDYWPLSDLLPHSNLDLWRTNNQHVSSYTSICGYWRWVNCRTLAKPMRDLFCHSIQSCKLGVPNQLFATHCQINRIPIYGPPSSPFDELVMLWAQKLHEESLYLHLVWKEQALTPVKQIQLDTEWHKTPWSPDMSLFKSWNSHVIHGVVNFLQERLQFRS